jgi:hypothetical protein
MTEDDDMTLNDIKRWYHDNGMRYEHEDWGLRDEVGESAGEQHQTQERKDLVRSSDSTPGRLWWWEKQVFPWRARTRQEIDRQNLLDDFFAPYLSMLPYPKLNLVQQVFNDLSTYTELAQSEKRARSTVHEATALALRDLTRIIANDDPTFKQPADGRRRDYAEEQRAARNVLDAYLTRRLEDR